MLSGAKKQHQKEGVLFFLSGRRPMSDRGPCEDQFRGNG